MEKMSGYRSLFEIEIKAAVLRELVKRKRLTANTVIANEYSLLGTNVRADLALGGESLIGVEIKSSADTLRRAHKQISAYEALFDRTIIVLADKHLPDFDYKKYEFTEIWSINTHGLIAIIRKPRKRPGAEIQYIRYLTAYERKHYAISQNSAPKQCFINAFNRKYARTSHQFWSAVSGREIEARDMDLLSRFKPKREKMRLYSSSQASKWDDWLVALTNAAEEGRSQSLQSSSVSYNPLLLL